MRLKILETAIEYAIQEGQIFNTWTALRDYLVENGGLQSAELDLEHEFILDCYLKHDSAKKQEGFRHPDTPPKSPENEPRVEACKTTPTQALYLDDIVERPPFRPTLDNSENAVRIHLSFLTTSRIF